MRDGRQERRQWLVQARGLPGRSVAPVAAVPVNGPCGVVDAEIDGVVVKGRAGRGVDKRQAQAFLVRMIPSVLAVVDDRDAETVVARRQVGPLLRGDFEQIRCVDAAPDGAESKVISRFRVS